MTCVDFLYSTFYQTTKLQHNNNAKPFSDFHCFDLKYKLRSWIFVDNCLVCDKFYSEVLYCEKFLSYTYVNNLRILNIPNIPTNMFPLEWWNAYTSYRCIYLDNCHCTFYRVALQTFVVFMYFSMPFSSRCRCTTFMIILLLYYCVWTSSSVNERVGDLIFSII